MRRIQEVDGLSFVVHLIYDKRRKHSVRRLQFQNVHSTSFEICWGLECSTPAYCWPCPIQDPGPHSTVSQTGLLLRFRQELHTTTPIIEYMSLESFPYSLFIMFYTSSSVINSTCLLLRSANGQQALGYWPQELSDRSHAECSQQPFSFHGAAQQVNTTPILYIWQETDSVSASYSNTNTTTTQVSWCQCIAAFRMRACFFFLYIWLDSPVRKTACVHCLCSGFGIMWMKW